MRVFIRCNANHSVGYGHISRCLSLAFALKEKKHKVSFIIGSDDAIERIKTPGFPVHVLADDADWENFSKLTQKYKPDTIILDARPPIDKHESEKLKRHCSCLVALDTIDPMAEEADLIFLPPHPANLKKNYRDFKGKVYIGFEWTLLGNGFKRVDKTEKSKGRKKILMTMGGADPWNYTAKLAPSLIQLCHEKAYQLGIVFGPAFEEKDKLIDAIRQVDDSIIVFDSPSHMGDVYAWCDAAIAIVCVSAYELAACGKAAIYICPNSDYKEHAQVFVAAGMGVALDAIPDLNDLRSAFEVLDSIGQPKALDAPLQAADKIVEEIENFMESRQDKL